MANKIDSNVTGLRYAEEASLRTLPGSPMFHPLEPNSYSDFGGQISTIARNPINPSRQRKKGVTTDLDASGGFNQDLTLNNTTRLLQGFFFADIREKKTTAPLNGTATAITGVTSADTYAAGTGLTGFAAGALVLATGFGVTANNGLKSVSSASTATALVVNEPLEDEASPPAAAKVGTVGFEFSEGEVGIALNGAMVRLVSSGTDLTTLGLIPGEWVFLGGDSASARFENNSGFARIGTLTGTYLEFDKVSWTPQVEAAGTKEIRIFFGAVLKNEDDPSLIKRRTYHVERTLGQDETGTMSEYLVGAVPNEMTLNIAQADKVNIDLSFVAVDNEQRTGQQGVKAGTRPALDPADAFNTSSDFARIKMASVTDNAAPQPLFAFATDMTLTINNNVTPNKAIGVLGAFDTSAGTFEVGGSLTAYFADVTAAQAVRNNEDITLDIIMLKRNAGMLFDIPLLSLGDGRLTVEQDQAITIPLENNAAESKFNHTLLFQSFAYLPNLAG